MSRPILTLKKPLDKRPPLASKKLNTTLATQWLESTYPEIFDRQDPRPLAIRIRAELCRLAPPASIRKGLSAALAHWCRRRRYQAQIAAGGLRYRLDGEVAGDISKEHRARAQEVLGSEDKNKDSAAA